MSGCGSLGWRGVDLWVGQGLLSWDEDRRLQHSHPTHPSVLLELRHCRPTPELTQPLVSLLSHLPLKCTDVFLVGGWRGLIPDSSVLPIVSNTVPPATPTCLELVC